MNRILHINGKICFSILLCAGILFISFSAFAQNSCGPYNVVMNIYDDPKTKMAFNWFTDNCNGCGKIQIVIGETTNQHSVNAEEFELIISGLMHAYY